LGEELQAKEVLHLKAVDFLGPVPTELFEGFQDGKVGRLDAAFDAALTALVELALDQSAQIIDVTPLGLGGLLGQIGVMVEDEGELKLLEVFLEERRFGFHDSGLGW
jgi:hypothetical protein